ncbi:MAG: InlB B-repeat-containing protein [Bacilli bacterium]|nr:InlB B-repeat-containing protein [Bacilli bacterium]
MKKRIFIILFFIILLILIGLIFYIKNSHVKTYYVTLDTDSESGTIFLKVEEGKKLSIPKNPIKEGYDFVEWQLDGKAFDFEKPVNDNITLKALWKKIQLNNEISEEQKITPVKYKVNFYLSHDVCNCAQPCNCTYELYDTKIVNEGSKVTMPSNPTGGDYYDFVEWQLNEEKFDFNTPITSDLDLFAKWEKSEYYTVIFYTHYESPDESYCNCISPCNCHNGPKKYMEQKIKKGEKVKVPENPTLNGYNFAGWLLDGKTFDFNTPITKNIELIAKWKSN